MGTRGNASRPGLSEGVLIVAGQSPGTGGESSGTAGEPSHSGSGGSGMQKKAVGLLSGGLDSILAVSLVKRQGISVTAVHFVTPFSASSKTESAKMEALAKKLGVELRVEEMGEEYLEMLQKPLHGYGKNVNPCIDCHALMLRRAGELMREVGAAFVFTGEVLGERPMSQHRRALEIVEREAGLAGQLLRPLSALLLPATTAEKQGLVDRARLGGISGRSRKPQMKLAEELGIFTYPGPAGGCLLTDPVYSRKVKDLMRHGELTLDNSRLLRTGRHYRLEDCVKLVVGRNEKENLVLERSARDGDVVLTTFPLPGPVALMRGGREGCVELAARVCAGHSDAKRENEVPVSWCRMPDGVKSVLRASPASVDEMERYRI